ncbi:aromatic ring-hydroxylating oxygenase subunit alpha [Nocardia miyunensis]|uniref:aromatic ring-hydroxylating oxygenase subunit alpha n=1 Tax=Nocardia miyunensis TaxID=282684 RepID=UPI0008355A3C|nr:aromatic ring-hydroxylating dioxygenase subunit alpha [Nocardia miyunensis]
MTNDLREYVDPDEGWLRGEIFTNEEIYQRELKEVFGRSWLFLAHDSMLRKPGDFLQTYMGEDPVVVVRQKDCSIKAFLNQCRHRGMRICRADRGRAKTFMCSFHGWAYDLAGKLINVAEEEAYYPQGIDKDAWSAVAVPRIEEYKGFYFGTWDETAPSLVDYLGDMAWYFDAYVDRYPGGLESVAQHKWVIGANWKLNAEQPASDALHGLITHASVLTVRGRRAAREAGLEGDAANLAPPVITGYQYSDPFGHGTGFSEEQPGMTKELRAWEDSIRDQILERVGQKRCDGVKGHGNIFPNFMILDNGTMRVTHPRGPNEFEIWAWTFVPAEAPEEVKESIRIDVLRTFSPGGMFEQDDAENWIEEQRIMRGFKARQSPLAYQSRIGDARMNAPDYPGLTSPHIFSDEAARGMYRHWLRMMEGTSWDELLELKKHRSAEPLAEDRAHVR